jgi:transposase InsO family protein
VERDTKQEEKTFKVKYLYEVFGLTKQGYYQRIKRDIKRAERDLFILMQVERIRKELPRSGTRKLLIYLRQSLEEAGIKIGRDALFTLLRHHGMLVKRTRRFHVTTDSRHSFKKSPNLIKESQITHSEQAIAADITYLKTDQSHAYLATLTDLYSKKIVGYCVADNMRVELVKQALKMAHKNKMFKNIETIHHSDRGIQYCCPDYKQFADKLGFKMSNTQQYDPYENAVAERINETLKYEFGLNRQFANLKELEKVVAQSVWTYNNKRVHWSLDLRTPEEVHQSYDSVTYKSYSKISKTG